MLDGHMQHRCVSAMPFEERWRAMDAVRGIVIPKCRNRKGRMRGFQLWINCPRGKDEARSVSRHRAGRDSGGAAGQAG
jgi:redox-sensitive bicupin YhaK (pirin superfamily)